jgi:hypothetical protein
MAASNASIARAPGPAQFIGAGGGTRVSPFWQGCQRSFRALSGTPGQARRIPFRAGGQLGGGRSGLHRLRLPLNDMASAHRAKQSTSSDLTSRQRPHTPTPRAREAPGRTCFAEDQSSRQGASRGRFRHVHQRARHAVHGRGLPGRAASGRARTARRTHRDIGLALLGKIRVQSRRTGLVGQSFSVRSLSFWRTCSASRSWRSSKIVWACSHAARAASRSPAA